MTKFADRRSSTLRRVTPIMGISLPMLLAHAPPIHAELGQARTDFGGVGLMQTPSARMAPLGDISLNYSHVSPYSRYNVSVQATDWLEAGFRYTSVANRNFNETIAGDRDYLDKGIDVKFRLLEEDRSTPALALGFRDFGGTGLFSSEYFVASKRWYDFDFSLGLGWGYLGAGGGIGNPLSAISDRFDERPSETSDDTGDFNLTDLFSGDIGLFGGVEYQTPWDPLSLQLEYDGNDYRSEPLDNPQTQDSPINLGARFDLNDNIALSAGWERGNTAMVGITLRGNLAGLSQPKTADPRPEPIEPAPTRGTDDWHGVSEDLAANAGMRVRRITRDNDELVVEAEATKYRSLQESENRANRILQNRADDDIQTFRYRWQSVGMGLRDDVHDRQAFVNASQSTRYDQQYRYGLYAAAITRPEDTAPSGERLYEDDLESFSWNLSPGLNQNMGGPDGYLYQLYAKLDAEYRTDANGWFSGQAALNLADNFDKYDYIASSALPRVRTNIGNYLDETSLGIYNLQYTRTARFGQNWYGMAYGGLLEMMYAGAGGEMLYRPFNSAFAFGVDLNWVKQRDFDQRFDMRDYDTWTGHATAYVDTGIEDVLAQVSVGRYLAGDIGTTVDLSRSFDSGVRVGAWATFTDAGDDYGEGSFDKGLYVSVPFDAFFTSSSRGSTTIAWQPLTRDGGARLARRYTLYGLTQDREMGRYWQDYDDVMP
ncbi:YjbH domain-containing protein [Salinicola avicenniae]|uniref:YjbH domain-containing protein n=1 Tax=Salinicola avicenniae TaxID=2916836 RepID=UPI002072FE22|nr:MULTISPECIES: YjbH domain-containing protein [unclassified Salinicola]